MDNHRQFWLACIGPLVLFATKELGYLTFQSFDWSWDLLKVISTWWRLSQLDEGYPNLLKVISTWWRLSQLDEGYLNLMKVIPTWWRLSQLVEGYPNLMKVMSTWWRLSQLLLWLRKTINVLMFTFRRMPGKMFSNL